MTPQTTEHKTSTYQAMAYVCSAYLAYVITDSILKWLASEYTVAQIVVMNCLFVLMILGISMALRKGIKGFFPPTLKWHLARGLCVMVTGTAIIYALPLLTLADFYGICFTSPFWILIFASIFLKEKIGWRRWLAVVTGFIGVFILAGPNFTSSPLGIALCALAATTIAASAIVSRKIGPGDDIELFGFYAVIFLLLVNLPFAITDFRTPEWNHLPIFGLQWVCFLIGQIGFAYGFAKAPEASVIAPLHYTQIIWATLIGYFLFGDIPGSTTVIGLTLIIGAGLFTFYREYRIRHPKE